MSFQSDSTPVCITSVWAFNHAYSVKVCASLSRTQLKLRLQGIFQKRNPLPWYMSEELSKSDRAQGVTAQVKQCVFDTSPCNKPERQSAMAALEPPLKKAASKTYTPVSEPVKLCVLE